MSKAKKLQVVENLRSVFNEYGAVILAHNKGLKVSVSREIKKLVKKNASGKYLIVKNSLAKIAVEGTKYESLKDKFVGPTALLCSDDPASLAKTLVKFCKDNKELELVRGALGADQLDAEQIKYLASLPSLEELRAKLVGLLQAPASKIASVLQAPASNVIGVLSAYSKTSDR